MDVLFIAGENDRTYHHTAGLVTLDTSATPQFDFDYFRRHTSERMDLIPHFRWKLQEVPLGRDLPYWVEDENFSYDNHFKRIAVPQPGDREALAEVASYIFSRHLDRSRPLWEMWYIEGLAGGRVAILQKLHHCMMDGQGMQKVGEQRSDFSHQGQEAKDRTRYRQGQARSSAGSAAIDRQHAAPLVAVSTGGLQRCNRHSGHPSAGPPERSE